MNRDQLMREIKSEQKKLKIERNQMRILGDKISRIKKEIAKYKGYIKSTKNSSTIANYQRVIYEKDAQVLTCEKDINRRNNAIYKIETKIEDLRNKMLEEDNKAKIALQQKVDELSISNQQLQKELQLQKEQKERAMKEKAKIIEELGLEFDVFISHASEDKEEIAEPLAIALEKKELKVFYDKVTIAWGDSIPHKIDLGLTNSKCAIVIISPSFMSKPWTNKEKDALQMLDETKIFPIWHKVTKAEVQKFSPTLSAIKALSTVDYTVEEIVDTLVSNLSGIKG